jgi:Holliday junction resolvase RusA-like endonuclease
MSSYSLTIPGDPASKGRPRFYQGRTITDAKTHKAEKVIADEFHRKYPDAAPLEGDVWILCSFYMGSRRRKDWDNLAKLVCDALNGIAYLDDQQITKCVCFKILPDKKRHSTDALTRDGEPHTPRTEILIEPANNSLI